jgi:UDP-glucose:tetrahydrobiopterin glucosyltransferase
MRIAFLSTPVSPLGNGIGGGVESTIQLLADLFINRGHQVTVFAPEGSVLRHDCVECLSGTLTPSIQTSQSYELVDASSFLFKAISTLLHCENNFDCIVNFSYDFLPFYSTPFFKIPFLHYVSMSHINDKVSAMIQNTAVAFPKRCAMLSEVQRESFNVDSKMVWKLKKGVAVDAFTFQEKARNYFVWSGRISPEKGIEDAISVANALNVPLVVCGKIQDHSYWESLKNDMDMSLVDYKGYLAADAYNEVMSHAQALLMTSHWLEAFGCVIVEALACGVPVVAYQHGGASEIVTDDVGFLVPNRNVKALTEAASRVGSIDRSRCRSYAEKKFSGSVFYESFFDWLKFFVK